MNLPPETVRAHLARDLGSSYEPALDIRVIARRGRRTQQRRAVIGSAAAALVVASAGVGAIMFNQPAPERAPVPATSSTPSESAAAIDISTDTENSPPKKFIAAGRIAVSAVYTTDLEDTSNDTMTYHRTWSLYNPKTGEYDETDWAWLDVARGLEQAAVLERELPTRRVGIFDMKSRTVTSWIELDHAVASVSWSPDGTKLLATAYRDNPDRADKFQEHSPPSTRTGYFIIGLGTGRSSFHELPPFRAASDLDEKKGPANVNRRQDVEWWRDGSMIWAPRADGVEDKVFYTLDGDLLDDAVDDYPGWATIHSPISPDGKLEVARKAAVPTTVVDRMSGKVVGQQNMFDLQAWTDNEHLIGIGGCFPPHCLNDDDALNGEAGLYLTSVNGKKVVRLSAATEDWYYLLTQR